MKGAELRNGELVGPYCGSKQFELQSTGKAKGTLFVVLAVVLALAIGACMGAPTAQQQGTKGTTTSSLESKKAECLALQRQWMNAQADFKRAQSIQSEYRANGCYVICGDLVEDSDTAVQEKRC